MCIYLFLFFGVCVRPSLFENTLITLHLVCFILVGNIGAFWMIYQAVRYDVLLAFIPFMFVWYSLVRVPLRKEFQGESDFIR